MNTQKIEPEALSAKDILTWLKGNPAFLKQHPEACEYLLPPEENRGKGIADFQTYMVQRLRQDKESVMETARDLIEVSRLNMNSVTRIHNATLKVLEARNFAEFIQAITMDLGAILDVDLSVLVVEASGVDAATLNVPGIRIVPQGTIQTWMGGQPVLLESDIQGVEHIYGGGARLVRSQAILRVDMGQDAGVGSMPPAILAFGSRDPEMFKSGQGTELVSYLARVIERVFRLWLAQAR